MRCMHANEPRGQPAEADTGRPAGCVSPFPSVALAPWLAPHSRAQHLSLSCSPERRPKRRGEREYAVVGPRTKSTFSGRDQGACGARTTRLPPATPPQSHAPVAAREGPYHACSPIAPSARRARSPPLKTSGLSGQ
jgi:hypothetical protein